ncbi:AtzE family amidohydrolase [Candidatus Tachikawaea gelatinosa]|uniref:Glu-tRNAGln amidotransferase A subunit n=1 Tax=Candidatus Tachikawaea gelatinosa TaxID=1410383 RepID=A0A090AL61_9ENTR|nr:AtzE family amidohydrolase [Candidatus Tachikawaea gelatinosa]BAP58339.1 Glu-tRNAGln amidotransferase A subunit [Candidatus Tachikawaea gelatinosa]
MNIFGLTIKQLKSAILKKKISIQEITKETIKNIQKYNPQLNAWITITEKRMLLEATNLEKKYFKNIKNLPLLGIPYGVKNIFNIKNYITLVGSKIFKKNKPAIKDAWTINKLLQSGALLTGALNMDAYAYGFTTENSDYGPTRNPHDHKRIAGGSSGGSAAAVSAGLIPFSLGTDTNGSIRVPASLCGIFGLKPTFGRISRNGVHVFSSSLDHVGHFARCVEDLALVYNVLCGRDIQDCFQSSYSDNSMYNFNCIKKGAKGLKCAVLGGFFKKWCDKHANLAVKKVAQSLNIQEEIILPEAIIARISAFIITASEAGNNYLPYLRKSLKMDSYSYPRLLAGSMIPNTWYIQAQRFRRIFQKIVASIFKKIDILIAPSTPCSATLIGQENMIINNTNFSPRVAMGLLTQPISFIGLPVCSVPLMTDKKLPIGIQIIASPFKEINALRIAWELEKKEILLKPRNIRL